MGATLTRVPEFDKLPRDLELLLSGEAFRKRNRLILPFLTLDPAGFPRACLLTLSEIRARSRTALSVAVRTGSHTAANLIRRHNAALLYLARDRAVWIQARAGRGRNCDAEPGRQIFPLSVFRVKVDRPNAAEETLSLAAGPTVSARAAGTLFSEALFEELGIDGAQT
ncbi:MAG TPA: hypothetical protein VLO07_08000 [Thermoanaerobaculia bacterium]|nr:hypothetical protein [Thermoanaerobaculia bacterium]